MIQLKRVSDDPMLTAIRAHCQRARRPLSADDIHDMANFRQRGGLGRLCAALAALSAEWVAEMEHRP